MSQENTTVVRCTTYNSDQFSVSREAYIVDLSTNQKYRLIDVVNAEYYPEKMNNGRTYAWIFKPVPHTCTNLRLIDGPLNLTINLDKANGRKVIHAGINMPSAVFSSITNDIDDLISNYYENLGLDDTRSFDSMHKISNIEFSKNGNILTMSCKTNSDQYDRYREILFDINQATFIEKTAYSDCSDEEGLLKFIHIKCPSGIFMRDDVSAGATNTTSCQE